VLAFGESFSAGSEDGPDPVQRVALRNSADRRGVALSYCRHKPGTHGVSSPVFKESLCLLFHLRSFTPSGTSSKSCYLCERWCTRWVDTRHSPQPRGAPAPPAEGPRATAATRGRV
jgi:hypothetical protein